MKTIGYRGSRLRHVGLCYLGVVLFILGGAILREIPMLVVLAGMMLAPIFINWRLAMASLRGLRIERVAPDTIEVGKEFEVELRLSQIAKASSHWGIALEDEIEWSGDGSKQVSVAEAFAPRISFQRPGYASYRCKAVRRGDHLFRRLRLHTRFPFGLVEAAIQLPLTGQFVATPTLGKMLRSFDDLLGDKELDEVESKRRQLSVGEGDYYAVREWRSGDSPRWVHWRTSAKLGRPAVKQFERQTKGKDLVLIVDLWSPSEKKGGASQSFEDMLSFAATAVCEWSVATSGRFLMGVAGDQAELATSSGRNASVTPFLRILGSASASANPKWDEVVARCRAVAAAPAALVVLSLRSQESAESQAATKLSQAFRVSPSAFHWVNTSQELSSWFRALGAPAVHDDKKSKETEKLSAKSS